MAFEPRVIHVDPGEELWVQSCEGCWEVGVQLNSAQYTYLQVDRSQLERFRDNINVALTER